MTDEPQTTPAPIKFCLPWRRWFFYLRVWYLIFISPLIFLAAAGVMVIERDITAPSWIVDRIEARADTVLGGGELRFGQISLRIGADLHPVVRLLDTQLLDESGLTLSRIPMVEALISPRGLIFQGEVLTQDIHLTGAQINLRRAADGTVAVAFAAGAQEVGQARSLPQLLDQMDQFFDRPLVAALESVSADGVIVNFDDARAGRSWIVDGGRLRLDLQDGRTALEGDLFLLSGRSDVTTVNLRYRSPRGRRNADFSLNIKNAIASDIATQSPALTWLNDVDAPITAALRTQLDGDGALGPLFATLEIGQGVFQPNPSTRPVAFESAKAYLTYDPVRDKISFSQMQVETEWGGLRADGEAYLREMRNGLPTALLTQFQFHDVVLNPSDLFADPLQISDAALDIRLRFDPFVVEVGQLVANDGHMRVAAQGEIAATNAGWRVAMDAQIDQLTPDRLLAYWPASMKPGTRRWFQNNLLEGRFFNLVAGLRMAPGVPPQFAGSAQFDQASVQFMRHVPPVTNGAGTVSFIDKALVVSVDQGQVTAAQGGVLQAAGSVFTIPNAGVHDAPAIVDLQVAGSVPAALSVLNQRPFQFMDKANLPVTVADGLAQVAGQINLILKKGMTPDDVTFGVSAELRDVRSNQLIPGRDLQAAQMTVTANREELVIGGPIQLGDVPLTGTWTQKFGPASGGDSQVVADVVLSQTFLDEFGIGLPSGSVQGTGTGQLTLDLIRGQAPAFRLVSDMRGLRVALAPLGWAKPANTAGELIVEGTLGQVPQVTNLTIRGGGLQAQGRIDLGRDGQLDAARFSRVRIGNWLDAPITVRGRGPGQAVGIEIAGGRLDLRRATFGSGQGDGGPMQIALDRLQITEGIALTGFRGDFNGSGGFSGQFNAQLNGAVTVRGSVAPRNGRSAVRIVSDDGGGVVRAAGLLRNAAGGDFDLTLLPAGDEGTFDGVLAMRGLRIRDAPTIAALLDAISVVGLLQQLDGQGLGFDAVDARFRLGPEQIIVSQSSAVGPGLGISLDGIYTLASKQMDFQGVVSPFYILNGIGSVLTRPGEGLVGFNFNIGGTSNAPKVSVNPLSVFTPGMFREIFRRPVPELNE